MKRALSIVVAAVMAVSGCAQQSNSPLPPAAAILREPVTVVPGNPTCADLGYAYSYKIDNVNGAFSGTFSTADGYLVVDGTSTDGVGFSFTSNVGVDVVIMKGGHAANVYSYPNETTGESGLVSPVNASGQPAAISHVTFCFDYEVRVAKTAQTSFTRDFAWALEKSTPVSALTLSVGQVQVAPYTVVVTNTGFTDSNFAVEGTITITNPAPVVATVTGVTDAMGAITAPVDCGQPFPLLIASGGSVTCSYFTALPDAATRSNVATVSTTGAVGGNQGSAAVDFGSAEIASVDGCVTVTDSMVGSLGSVCTADAPRTFEYTAEIGPFTADGCGQPFPVANVVSFSDGSDAVSATATVDVTVACPQIGCTLTQGYWKTHSSYGPARFDDTWALLPQGADTAFFGSGLSWYSAFWTAPRGNAYWILAHQFAAATLNGLNGADTSVVAAELTAAEALLSSTTPSTFPASDAATARQLAGALDAYNNGVTGPGHCSE